MQTTALIAYFSMEIAFYPRCQATAALYEKLDQVVLPRYQQNREGWLNVMRHSIALNGSFFNTQRMLLQYVLRAYFV
jgi:glucan phosphorylase